MDTSSFDPKATQIAARLLAAGHQVYYVGGAVRDLLRGVTPKDTDLATSAAPEQVQRVFSDLKVDLAGKAFLVAIVDGVEVATFRSDSYDRTSTGPIPASLRVHPVPTILDDLERRDFTVNAIAVDAATGTVIDPHNGVRDLEQHMIRFVGKPALRIQEDPLRVLRGLRFLVAMDGRIPQDSLYAMMRAPGQVVQQVPMERIQQEVKKVLRHKNASRFFRYLDLVGLLPHVFPHLQKTINVDGGEHHGETVFEHCMLAGDAVSPKYPLVKLAAYLHDIGKPFRRTLDEGGKVVFTGHEVLGETLVTEVLRHLRFPLKEALQVQGLVRLHMRAVMKEETSGKAIRRLGRELDAYGVTFADWLRLRQADRTGNLYYSERGYNFSTLRQSWTRIKGAYRELEGDQSFSTRNLALDGHDVMRILKVGPGQVVGQALEWLLDQVLMDPSLNNPTSLESLMLSQWEIRTAASC